VEKSVENDSTFFNGIVRILIEFFYGNFSCGKLRKYRPKRISFFVKECFLKE